MKCPEFGQNKGRSVFFAAWICPVCEFLKSHMKLFFYYNKCNSNKSTGNLIDRRSTE